MQKKSAVYFSIIALGALALVLVIKFANPLSHGEKPKSDAAPANQGQQGAIGNAPNEEVAKLNNLQKEIAALGNEEIDKQMETLKTRVEDSGLLEKYKSGKLEPNERKDAKELLIRLALLRSERVKRATNAANLEAKKPAGSPTPDANQKPAQ